MKKETENVAGQSQSESSPEYVAETKNHRALAKIKVFVDSQFMKVSTGEQTAKDAITEIKEIINNVIISTI